VATVVTTPATGVDLGIAEGLTALEVRTEAVVLRVVEREDGGLELDARPVPPRRLTGTHPDRLRFTIRAAV